MLRTETSMKILLFSLGVFFLFTGHAGAYYVDPKEFGSPKGELCILCHREVTPGIYNQWIDSTMGQAGVNCYDCHKAEESDPDAFEHKELIAIVVTPKDCSRCHEKEFKEYGSSHHADAVNALNSFDNFLDGPFGEPVLIRPGALPVTGQRSSCKRKGKANWSPAPGPIRVSAASTWTGARVLVQRATHVISSPWSNPEDRKPVVGVTTGRKIPTLKSTLEVSTAWCTTLTVTE